MPTILQPRARATVGGATRRVVAANTNVGFRTAVAQATITLDPREGFATPGQAVRLDLGFGASLTTVFTGTIDEDGVVFNPWGMTISCSGALLAARQPVGVQDTSLTAYAYSDGTFPAAAWANRTDGFIVKDILSRLYGITQLAIADAGQTLGTIQPVTLRPDEDGWRLIQELDQLLGYKTFDGPDGVVRRLPLIGVPAGGASVTFTEGTNLLLGQRRRSSKDIKNDIVCKGLPGITGSTGATFQPVGEARAASPYVPSPPTYRAEEFNTSLAETQTVCQAYAARRLGEMNRLQETVEADFTYGQPAVRPAATCAIHSATLGYDDAMRFWAEQVQHKFDRQGLQTHLTLKGAYAADGYNPDQAPVAVCVAAAIEQETLADGSTLTTVSLDGSGSYDPDGTVVSYQWSGSPVTPTATNKGMSANAIYTGTAWQNATVTLTVTDDKGLQGTTTITIGGTTAPIQTRDLWLAVSSDLLYSMDGQKTWYNAGVAAVGCCRQAAPAYQLAWDGAGDLWKVVQAGQSPVTFTTTKVLAGKAVTSAWIGYSFASGWTHIAYAGCASGDVYRSTDDGGTWTRVGAPTAAAINDLQESAYAQGELSCVAGPSLWHSFDAGATWTAQYTIPVSGLTAVRVTTGFGQGWVGYSGPVQTGEPSRIEERNNLAALDVPAAAKPLTPTGLQLALTEDRLYLTDTDSSGNGRTWTAAADASGMFTQKTWNQASYGKPNDMVRDGAVPGLLYIAADKALVKSPDEFGTLYTSKSLTSPQVGKMIGYGLLRQRAFTPTTVKNDVGSGKTYTLGTGPYTTPPNAWQSVPFDDSAWTADIAMSGFDDSSFYTVVPGTGWTSIATGGVTNNTQWLYRRIFILPAGTIAQAQLQINVDEAETSFPLIYLNGRDITSTVALPPRSGGPPTNYVTVALPPSWLISNGTNVLAAWIDSGGGPTAISFVLTVS
ncbi:MAG TPA: hypothetical protein VFL91_00710 [Thermomicrobiales bacterium]|nr:hypothetical protein [Thermomicrobiales bacterium]